MDAERENENDGWADSGPTSAAASPAATPPATGMELSIRVRRKPIPRKGHTKSRRGCFNCKRRKVKCQETRPECANCTRIGLACEYPDGRPRSVFESTLAMISAPAVPLQSSPTQFSFTDLRFFHHFLVAGYPPLPIMGEEIWRSVAVLSHSYDYLMHAMLGMAASHLSVYGGDFESHALSHRVKAIQSLNKALSTPARCTAEADARFGTIMSLAFQASCMPEGMTEFMAMIKGCHVIATTSLRAFEDSIFHEFTRHGYTYDVRNAIGTAPVPLDPEQESLLDEFLESLRALAPLCSNPLEVRFMAATERVVRLARISAKAAFAEFGHQYTIVNLASKEEFESFMDPKNYSAQLQLIHFILIEYAIGYFALGRFGRRFAYREKSSIAWMQRVADALPDEYKKYAKWPMDFVTKRMPYL